MDEVNADLTLDRLEYDPSPSADYGSWFLLEEMETETMPLLGLEE